MAGGERLALLGYSGYKGAVTAHVVQLDLHIFVRETKGLLEFCRQNLATPLKYQPPEEDQVCVVEASLMPSEPKRNKRYAWFHVDAGSAREKNKANPLLLAHLRYRERPAGPVPQELRKNKSAGFTIEWVEKVLRELQDEAKGGIIIVEAELKLPMKDRKKAVEPMPAIQLDKSSLRRRGEEYRSDATTPGTVSRYRWLERESGEISVWLTYSHTNKTKESFFLAEEARCRDYLKRLL